MSRLSKVQLQRDRRRNRIANQLNGDSERPRLRVVISNQHISAQLINDADQATIATATTVGKKSVTGTMTEKAEWVGTEIAKLAKKHKISKVVFDRGSKRYHGRVKQLAESARKAGLEF